MADQRVFTGFLSYARADADGPDAKRIGELVKEIERQVSVRLPNAKFELWWDRELSPGDVWNAEIEKALAKADVFIALLSPNWLSSDFCRKEFDTFRKREAAEGLTGRIFPVAIHDVAGLEPMLTRVQVTTLRRLLRRQVIKAPMSVLPGAAAQRAAAIDAVAGAITKRLLAAWPSAEPAPKPKPAPKPPREGGRDPPPLPDVTDREQLEAWFRTQPRAVMVAIASRAALRVWPVLAAEKNVPFDILFLSSYGAAVAWVAGMWPTDVREAAANAGADAADHAIGYAATRGAESAAVAAGNAANASAKVPAADAAALAAYAAVAAANAADAFAADAYAASALAHDMGVAAGLGLSRKANKAAVEAELAAFTALPLWSDRRMPESIDRLWRRAQERLVAARDDAAGAERWDVWLKWYELILNGQMSRDRALVYTRLPREILKATNAWAANRWLAAELEQSFGPAPDDTLIAPRTYDWSADGTLGPLSINFPAAFDLPGGPEDLAKLLDATRKLAERARKALGGKHNAPTERLIQTLDQALEDMPTSATDGNILLFGASMRELRDHYDEVGSGLSTSATRNIVELINLEIALRPYFPIVGQAREQMASHHQATPLPIDAVIAIRGVVEKHTPTTFQPGTAATLGGAPAAEPPPATGTPEPLPASVPKPVPDPDAGIPANTRKGHPVAGVVNAFWKAFQEGEKLGKSVKGWKGVLDELKDPVKSVLDWWSGGGPPG